MHILRKIRKEQHMTTIELAAKLGMSTSTISKAENGCHIRYSTFRRICHGLGVDPNTVPFDDKK